MWAAMSLLTETIILHYIIFVNFWNWREYFSVFWICSWSSIFVVPMGYSLVGSRVPLYHRCARCVFKNSITYFVYNKFISLNPYPELNYCSSWIHLHKAKPSRSHQPNVGQVRFYNSMTHSFTQLRKDYAFVWWKLHNVSFKVLLY